MKSLLKKHYFIYGISAIIAAVISLFTDEALDIMVADTYFVVSNSQLLLVVAFLYTLFAILSLGIESSGGKTNNVMFLIHYIISSGCILLLAGHLIGFQKQPVYEDYTVIQDTEQTGTPSFLVWTTLCLIGISLWQFTFLAIHLLHITIRRRAK